MGSSITPERIRKYKDYVREHPPQPEWDEEAEYFDNSLPYDEETSRIYRIILQKIGEWDYENDCPKP